MYISCYKYNPNHNSKNQFNLPNLVIPYNLRQDLPVARAEQEYTVNSKL